MVKQEPVSINWQSVFMLIPFIDLWAAYRIEKLRRYLLLIWVPSFFVFLFLSPLILAMYFEEELNESVKCTSDWVSSYFFDSCDPIEMQVFDTIITILLIVLAVFLIRKWSTKCNEKISTNL